MLAFLELLVHQRPEDPTDILKHTPHPSIYFVPGKSPEARAQAKTSLADPIPTSSALDSFSSASTRQVYASTTASSTRSDLRGALARRDRVALGNLGRRRVFVRWSKYLTRYRSH